MRLGRWLSLWNMQTWPENLLNLVNSAAYITSIVDASLVLLSVLLLYFSHHEIANRTREAEPPGEGPSTTPRITQLHRELAPPRNQPTSFPDGFLKRRKNSSP